MPKHDENDRDLLHNASDDHRAIVEADRIEAKITESFAMLNSVRTPNEMKAGTRHSITATINKLGACRAWHTSRILLNAMDPFRG